MRNNQLRALTFTQERAAIKSARRGDAAGFHVLYEAHRAYVYSVCLRMTCNTTLSEDLMQDVFLQVWRKIRSYKGDSKFRTWLHRVTINVVLMHFRRHKHRISTVSLEESVLPAAERELMNRETSLHIDDRISVRNLVRRLTPGHQQILSLHEIQGYRHEDISHLLGISSGASKSQLHKALTRLRVALGLRSQQKVRGKRIAWQPAA